jgi:hypothetical protein
MRRPTTALAAALCLAPGPAFAQQVDDWAFVETEEHGMIAITEFAGGQAILAQCRDGELKVMLTGLPTTTERARDVQASRADGRHSPQTWLASETPGVFTAAVPGRQARFLRGGGTYEIRTAEGEMPPVRATFDLPAASANLDRVITGCRWAIEDERDALEQPGPQSFEWARSRGRAPQPDRPRPRRREGQLVSIVHLSCIVRDLRLAECRADHQLPVSGPHGTMAARNMNGERLAAPDPTLIEGRVVYLTTETEETRGRP